MNDFLLRVATRFMLPLLLLFALFLLLRGHNAPGGGFAAGLVVAIGLALYALSTDAKALRHLIPLRARTAMAAGLLAAVGSGLVGLTLAQPFLRGIWLPWEFPILGGLAIGTPLLFDVGVFFVSAGAMLAILLSLADAER